MQSYLARPKRSQSHRAFTLIELLTVIAIIGILAAIIIPVTGKVRAKGASIRSTANLRQLGVAISLFINDNKQSFPYAAAQLTNPSGGWAYLGSWDTFIASYLGLKAAPDGSVSGAANQMKLFEHSRDSGILSPQFAQNARRSYAMPSNSAFLSIAAWSGTFGDPSVPRPKRMNEVPQLSQTILLTERPGYDDNYVGRTGRANINSPAEQLANQPDLNGGGNKFNYLFADGHVKLLDPRDTIGTGKIDAPKGFWTVAAGD